MKADIDPDFFSFTCNELDKAVDEAFPAIDYNSPDQEFAEQLKTNNKVFAAFKAHRQQNDVARLLLDQDGNLKPFEQFRQDVNKLLGFYNRDWLRTEYSTAVVRARMAARFRQFERDADLYPNLKWMKSTSYDQREKHVRLYGLILPINHPFWENVFPGDEWNCKCGITNTDQPENSGKFGIDKLKYPPHPAGLEGNPAKTGKIFGDKHPYRAEAYKGAKKAVNNFMKKP